jgi:RNA polymerase sigma factor (sigma-70 family)
VANPIYELVPVSGFQEAAAALPPHASVTVTASPRLGVDATLDAAEWLAAQGHDVCPHLAARAVRDRAHLADLLARLRMGDEAAFMTLVDRYGPLMLRIALSHVPSRAVAEEVVQEAWLGVLTGLDRFEGRSSLKTWILRIVANRARTRGERERRSIPLSAFESEDEPSVTRLEGSAAVEAIIANTYRGAYVRPMGMTRQHMLACAELARTVPVFRARRRWGYDNFDAEGATLEAHARQMILGN